MGSSCSVAADDPIRTSKKIDKELYKEKDKMKSKQKMLLLGTGECGKSTILKQVRILHDQDFGGADREERKYDIFSNIIIGMEKLCDGAKALGLCLSKESESNLEFVKALIATSKSNRSKFKISFDAKQILQALWKDEVVLQAFERRNELQIADSIEYFLNNLDRIAATNYSPSNDDFLQLRIPTTGVLENRILIKGSQFIFIDVGGQRSERKKWLHQFDSVSAVIFLSAISEYDQVLMEDRNVNRMRESMQLWQSISRSSFFTQSSMILFLNKRDLFLEKIKKKPITVLFHHYRGSNDYDECVAFLKKEFEKLADTKMNGKNLYMHETCATDTDQVKLIIESVIDAIITRNLQGAGMDM